MTTPKAKLAGLALIAAMCGGFTLGLTAPAWAGVDEAVAAYERGDYATALREWRPLAEQGVASAQHNLGILYDRGLGTPQDYAEAVKWYRKAAEQGYALGQDNLGLMYAGGKGVARDYVEAVKWFNIATSRLPQGQEAAEIAELHDLLAKDMTPAQIAEAARLAREWKPKTK